jgi:hypothetical protein
VNACAGSRAGESAVLQLIDPGAENVESPVRNRPEEQRAHQNQRAALRVVGPFVLGLGLLLAAVGIGSFFASFGTFEPPRYFWCAFIGLPLVGLGVAICKFAFLGSVLRYTSDEVSPVAKDTFNYMAGGVRPGVEDLTGAVVQGLGREPKTALTCPACGQTSPGGAKYCAGCGAALHKTCASCGQENATGSRFCSRCGQELN